ncbi:MAG: peptidoglycan bridge formation glycyltransferase FemA/FemB family protein [Patescibacteria group bacterium]
MKIIPINEKYKKDWDNIVYNSDDAWLFHLYDWNTLINENVWQYKQLSFLIQFQNKIVGICPLFFKKQSKLKLLSTNILSNGFGPSGLALDNKLNKIQRNKAQDIILKHISSIAKNYKIDKLEISLPPLAFKNFYYYKNNLNPIKQWGLNDISTKTYLINLQNKSNDDLWSNMEKRSRTAIRKAKKHNITIIKASALDDLKKYYNLHLQTYKRTGAKPHPFSYFKIIRDKKWANIFFAYLENNLIGALNIAIFKGNALYWTSASNHDFNSLGVNNLLQWHAIKWAKEQNCQWYDSGEAILNTKNTKFAGLTNFKKSFGGELYPFYKGNKIYSAKSNLIKIIKKWIL